MRVVLIAAQSLDGFIAKHDLPGTAFTSPEDKHWFPACLRDFDCSVMGAATYREARSHIFGLGPRDAAIRRRVVLTRHPKRFAADAIPGRVEFTHEPAAALVARLHAERHRHCALLGGGEINGLFLRAGLVDEAWITIEPRLFGEGRPVGEGRLDVSLHLNELVRLGPDVVLLKYAVDRGRQR